MAAKIERSDAEWREILNEQQYEVLRLQATERPFSGAYYATGEPGVYLCAGCGARLFESSEKFDSGCGWPSFTAPAENEAIEELADQSHGMRRTEVRCARCGGHLGHVFPDGPGPTGLRYCINSLSLKFQDADGELAEEK